MNAQLVVRGGHTVRIGTEKAKLRETEREREIERERKKAARNCDSNSAETETAKHNRRPLLPACTVPKKGIAKQKICMPMIYGQPAQQ